MARRLASFNALTLDGNVIGTRVLVTPHDRPSFVGTVSDVLQVQPGEWRLVAWMYGLPTHAACLIVSGCVVWIDGEAIVLVAQDVVLGSAGDSTGAAPDVDGSEP